MGKAVKPGWLCALGRYYVPSDSLGDLTGSDSEQQIVKIAKDFSNIVTHCEVVRTTNEEGEEIYRIYYDIPMQQVKYAKSIMLRILYFLKEHNAIKGEPEYIIKKTMRWG